MKTSLLLALGLPEARGITAIVGGGGKTSLMYRLAEELADAGRAPVVSTTTRIFPPEKPDIEILDSVAGLVDAAVPGKTVCIGSPCPGGKLSYPGDEVFFAALSLADRLIVEADGARHCPVKAPGEFEPVIPAEADSVIAVAGLDALGRSFAEVCFRAEAACGILGTGKEDIISPLLLAQLLVSEQGQRKALPSGAGFSVVLNKADDPRRLALGRETAEHIRRLCPECPVLITALEQPECIKAVYK